MWWERGNAPQRGGPGAGRRDRAPAALRQEDLEGSLEPHRPHAGRFYFAQITPPARSQVL